jgi:hypothetical protein
VSPIPHYTEYKCTICGRETERSLLLAKKVTFQPLGPGANITRSRTVAWICDECITKDPEYNLPAFKGSPGLKSPALERVREAEAKSGDD